MTKPEYQLREEKAARRLARLRKKGASEYQYLDLQAHWRKFKPILNSDAFITIMERDLAKHQRRMGCEAYVAGLLPYQVETTGQGWRHCRFSRGRPPAYEKYCCYKACHWLVNFTLYLARAAFPDREWQIVTSSKHSTVVDLESKTFFDFNYYGMGVSVEECWAATVGYRFHKLLPVGEERFLNH